MTKTELIRVQTKNIIELLENEFNAIDFDNDQGSYFTFSTNTFNGILRRNGFDVMLEETIELGPGFEEEQYNRRDQAIILERKINSRIQKYLNQTL